MAIIASTAAEQYAARSAIGSRFHCSCAACAAANAAAISFFVATRRLA